MAESIKTFVGTWSITQVAGNDPPWQPGYQLQIGTGSAGATAPYLAPDGLVAAGFALLKPAPGGGFVPFFSSADQQQQPLVLLLVDGTLAWKGYYAGKLLQISISAMSVESQAKSTFTALYGTTVAGDPQQVGVWGAEASPPPP